MLGGSFGGHGFAGAIPTHTSSLNPMLGSTSLAAPMPVAQPVFHQEQVVHRHVPVVHEQTVEVPHVQYQERIVEVPHVQTQEVVRHVPVPIVQEREVQVAKIEYVEKIVEVPQIQTVEVVRHVPVEVP